MTSQTVAVARPRTPVEVAGGTLISGLLCVLEMLDGQAGTPALTLKDAASPLIRCLATEPLGAPSPGR